MKQEYEVFATQPLNKQLILNSMKPTMDFVYPLDINLAVPLLKSYNPEIMMVSYIRYRYRIIRPLEHGRALYELERVTEYEADGVT
jgi:hypothetical protein